MYHHHADMAKAHEILAKLRPIAPKPPLPLSSEPAPSKPILRARPGRARKRGRPGILPPPDNKHQKAPPSLPVEQDLLNKLKEPRVITPRPVRPVGSCITVTSVTRTRKPGLPAKRRPEEVEEEVELESLPAVVSGAHNRVRLANWAYKEMVGQPECPWLVSMVPKSSSSSELGLETAARVSSRRINGEVVIELPESWEIPVGSGGFSCMVKVEWTCNGKRNYVQAPCEAVRVWCDANDYMFTWKIRTSV